MKKYLSVISLVLAVLFVFAVLASCGKKDEAYLSREDYDDGLSYKPSESNGSIEYPELSDSIDGSLTSSEANSVLTGRKIIERITLNVQTKEYDVFISGIDAEVAKLGGYIESSDISGSSSSSVSGRRASLVIRIPSNVSTDFSDFVSSNSTVVRKETSTEDVTLSYVDIESRLSALVSEKEALEKMLSEADTVENIIYIRSSLSDVIYEIESYESRLREMKNLIDYSTVTLNVSEVERTVAVEKQTAWQKIGTNLSNNISDIGEGLVSLFVFLVSALPYFIVIGIVPAVVLIIVFSCIKKKKKRNRAQSQTNNE